MDPRGSKEPQTQAMNLLEIILHQLVSQLPKVIVMLPVPMLISSWDFATILDVILMTRSGLYEMLSASQDMKLLYKSSTSGARATGDAGRLPSIFVSGDMSLQCGFRSCYHFTISQGVCWRSRRFVS
jgi:hypothetical protein